MNNPYSLVFGVEPTEYISRLSQTNEIVENLDEGSVRIYMVTGVRGCGKTVIMNEIKKIFNQKKDWIVVELSTERDMLKGLIGKLEDREKLAKLFKSASINFSAAGFGIEIKGEKQIADEEIVLHRMLEILKKHKKRLLVLVDEAVDNQPVREFASVFQIMIRDELPVNLMLTGLYENIDDLQNEKNLTFLHRAPKVHLNPLNIGTMAASYGKNLAIDREKAVQLAQITRGYPYAFQVLGYFMYENGGNYEDAIVILKQYLEEYVYDKIWSGLSVKDKKIAHAISETPSGKISEIRNLAEIASNEFAPYKKRLFRKGIISNETGYVRFTLPFFDEYVKENYYM